MFIDLAPILPLTTPPHLNPGLGIPVKEEFELCRPQRFMRPGRPIRPGCLLRVDVHVPWG